MDVSECFFFGCIFVCTCIIYLDCFSKFVVYCLYIVYL